MRNQQGLSLVELMISMTIGLFLIMGLGQSAFLINKNHLIQEEQTLSQENGRFALEVLSKEIRMAGNNGCTTDTPISNVLISNNPYTDWMTHVNKGILGIPLTYKEFFDKKAKSEALVVYRLDLEKGNPVLSMSFENNELSVLNAHKYNKGDIVAVVSRNCQQIGIFKVTHNNSPYHIGFLTNTFSSLYNCSSQITGSFTCKDIVKKSMINPYKQAMLYPVIGKMFYVRENEGQPSLYQKEIGETISGVGKYTQPILLGIEKIGFKYGIDENGDQQADRYLTVNDIPLFSDLWRSVVSVRIDIVVRSNNYMSNKNDSYWFMGEKIITRDQFFRKKYSSSIKIRNQRAR